jgi:hypothetical protein
MHVLYKCVFVLYKAVHAELDGAGHVSETGILPKEDRCHATSSDSHCTENYTVAFSRLRLALVRSLLHLRNCNQL